MTPVVWLCNGLIAGKVTPPPVASTGNAAGQKGGGVQ